MENVCKFLIDLNFSFCRLSITVDDASGHYTTGLFYGNNYWIGSLSLCKSIYKDLNSRAAQTMGKQEKWEIHILLSILKWN